MLCSLREAVFEHKIRFHEIKLYDLSPRARDLFLTDNCFHTEGGSIKLVNGEFRILPGELKEEFPAKNILASNKTLKPK